MLKRITKRSLRDLLVSWSPELEKQIDEQLATEPGFLTVQRVASVVDISESTVRRFVRQGALTVIESVGPNSSKATTK